MDGGVKTPPFVLKGILIKVEKTIIYADNAATTRVSDTVFAAMKPYFCERYGNASSIYSIGYESEKALTAAREQVAKAINADSSEIYFTGGGSESDNWAIKGAALRKAKTGKMHIVSTAYEHHAVLSTLEALKTQGFTFTLVKPTPEGIITPEAVAAAIREDTALVTVMTVNNEIGTINPIAEIAEACALKGVLFHTDAVQAVGHIPVDVKALGADMLSLSAHKFNGPKGVGALYLKKGVRVVPLVNGGQQESGKRAGTENIPGIVGLGTAITEAAEHFFEENARVTKLRDKLTDGLLALPATRLNGSREKRVPGNVNISFEGIEGESLLLWMDMNGICASSGSACTSRSLEPSHVLLSIGLPHETAHGSLRLSLGRYNTEADVDYILKTIPPIVNKLRAMSPVWEGRV